MDPRCRERECEHEHHLLIVPAACPYMHSSQRVGLKRNFETKQQTFSQNSLAEKLR